MDPILQQIQQKQQEAESLQLKMQEMLDAAEKDNRALTDDERTKWDEHFANHEKLTTEIETLNEDLERARKLGAIPDFVTPTAPETRRRSSPDSLRITREEHENDPQRGFKTPREFLHAVLAAGRTQNTRMDARLKPLQQLTAGSDEQSTVADEYGGFLIPEGFSPQLLMVEPDIPDAARPTMIPMTNPIVKIPSRVDKTHTSSVTGGLQVTRKAETSSGTATRMETELVTIEAHSLFGLAYATEELLTDSPISFAAILDQGFQQEFRSKILNERLWGTGIGEFLGVMESPCLVSHTRAGSTITFADVVNMRARCWRYGDAVWLAHNDTLPALMQLTGGDSANIWHPSAREGESDLLLGRPIVFTEYCQTVGTAGDIICGNWTQYLEGTYQTMQRAESIHVRFENHERTFKFWLRNGGSPWWRSSLTPKRGSTTLSPFVALTSA